MPTELSLIDEYDHIIQIAKQIGESHCEPEFLTFVISAEDSRRRMEETEEENKLLKTLVGKNYTLENELAKSEKENKRLSRCVRRSECKNLRLKKKLREVSAQLNSEHRRQVEIQKEKKDVEMQLRLVRSVIFGRKNLLDLSEHTLEKLTILCGLDQNGRLSRPRQRTRGLSQRFRRKQVRDSIRKRSPSSLHPQFVETSTKNTDTCVSDSRLSRSVRRRGNHESLLWSCDSFTEPRDYSEKDKFSSNRDRSSCHFACNSNNGKRFRDSVTGTSSNGIRRYSNSGSHVRRVRDSSISSSSGSRGSVDRSRQFYEGSDSGEHTSCSDRINGAGNCNRHSSRGSLTNEFENFGSLRKATGDVGYCSRSDAANSATNCETDKSPRTTFENSKESWGISSLSSEPKPSKYGTGLSSDYYSRQSSEKFTPSTHRSYESSDNIPGHRRTLRHRERNGPVASSELETDCEYPVKTKERSKRAVRKCTQIGNESSEEFTNNSHRGGVNSEGSDTSQGTYVISESDISKPNHIAPGCTEGNNETNNGRSLEEASGRDKVSSEKSEGICPGEEGSDGMSSSTLSYNCEEPPETKNGRVCHVREGDKVKSNSCGQTEKNNENRKVVIRNTQLDCESSGSERFSSSRRGFARGHENKEKVRGNSESEDGRDDNTSNLCHNGVPILVSGHIDGANVNISINLKGMGKNATQNGNNEKRYLVGKTIKPRESGSCENAAIVLPQETSGSSQKYPHVVESEKGSEARLCEEPSSHPLCPQSHATSQRKGSRSPSPSAHRAPRIALRRFVPTMETIAGSPSLPEECTVVASTAHGEGIEDVNSISFGRRTVTFREQKAKAGVNATVRKYHSLPNPSPQVDTTSSGAMKRPGLKEWSALADIMQNRSSTPHPPCSTASSLNGSGVTRSLPQTQSHTGPYGFQRSISNSTPRPSIGGFHGFHMSYSRDSSPMRPSSTGSSTGSQHVSKSSLSMERSGYFAPTTKSNDSSSKLAERSSCNYTDAPSTLKRRSAASSDVASTSNSNQIPEDTGSDIGKLNKRGSSRVPPSLSTTSSVPSVRSVSLRSSHSRPTFIPRENSDIHTSECRRSTADSQQAINNGILSNSSAEPTETIEELPSTSGDRSRNARCVRDALRTSANTSKRIGSKKMFNFALENRTRRAPRNHSDCQAVLSYFQDFERKVEDHEESANERSLQRRSEPPARPRDSNNRASKFHSHSTSDIAETDADNLLVTRTPWGRYDSTPGEGDDDRSSGSMRLYHTYDIVLPGRGDSSDEKRSISTSVSDKHSHVTSRSGGLPDLKHDFVKKLMLKAGVCEACNGRVRFLEWAAKCRLCHAAVHSRCRALSLFPCVWRAKTIPDKAVVLEEYIPKERPFVPTLVSVCVGELEARGLVEEGLYRVSGSRLQVDALRKRLLSGNSIPQPSQLKRIDSYVLCDVITSFLAALKEPLVPPDALHLLLQCAEDMDHRQAPEGEVAARLRAAVSHLSPARRDTLTHLVTHLQRVAASPPCHTAAPALAVTFAPALFGTALPQGVCDPHGATHHAVRQAAAARLMLDVPAAAWLPPV